MIYIHNVIFVVVHSEIRTTSRRPIRTFIANITISLNELTGQANITKYTKQIHLGLK